MGAADERAVDADGAVPTPAQHKGKVIGHPHDVAAGLQGHAVRGRESGEEAVVDFDVDGVVPQLYRRREGGQGLAATSNEEQRLEALEGKAGLKARAALGEREFGVGLLEGVDGAGLHKQLGGLMASTDTRQQAARLLVLAGGDERAGAGLHAGLEESELDAGLGGEGDEFLVKPHGHGPVFGTAGSERGEAGLEGGEAGGAAGDGEDRRDGIDQRRRR